MLTICPEPETEAEIRAREIEGEILLFESCLLDSLEDGEIEDCIIAVKGAIRLMKENHEIRNDTTL